MYDILLNWYDPQAIRHTMLIKQLLKAICNSLIQNMLIFSFIVLCLSLLGQLLQENREHNSIMAAKHLALKSGAKMPVIGLGTWGAPAKVVATAVENAIDAGYRHIDCAHDYENESEVGDGIKAKLDGGVIKREELFVTSKLWLTSFAPNKVKPAIENSLKKLKLEYLDLYLLHFPFALKENQVEVKDGNYDVNNDESIDYVDTWKELIKLQKSGLTRSIGVSNFNRFQLERLSKETSYVPDVHQFECHPYLDQTDMVEFCQSKGIVVTGYSPLGSPGNRDISDPTLFEEPILIDIAKKYMKTVAQVLLRYQIQRNVIVIPKSVTPARITSNIDLFNFVIDEGDMTKIKNLNRNWRTCDVDGWASKSHKYYPFRKDYTE
uniref:aldo-keto reductase family 1 member B1-like n=1 Tax=Styela clava TaxID=7725 RepID=UPI00193ADD2E|nr:aldo-keto reductase family 1 member B1-like [Styela clava]